MKKVLFICTGNTCRSPMAAALFNALAAEKNIGAAAASAGLSAFTGDTANDNSVKAMAELGIDISAHRARRFDIRMAEEYDLIAVMSQEQKKYLEACGIDPGKIISMDISDPYGGNIEVYCAARDEISGKLSAVTERLGQVNE